MIQVSQFSRFAREVFVNELQFEQLLIIQLAVVVGSFVTCTRLCTIGRTCRARQATSVCARAKSAFKFVNPRFAKSFSTIFIISRCTASSDIVPVRSSFLMRACTNKRNSHPEDTNRKRHRSIVSVEP